jgi:iron-sulfur cluster assembly protein
MTTLDPITLTDNAAQAVLKRMQKAPEGTKGLRLVVKATGCSGHSYAMEYVAADDPAQQDDLVEMNGAALYVPKMHSWMLFGAIVDYGADELGNEKFLFNNPNETGRCGCGESFQVKAD